MEIRALTPAEQKYTYAQSMQLEGQTANIGHLRGDFDSSGYGFYTTWTDTRTQWKPSVKEELRKIKESRKEQEADKGTSALDKSGAYDRAKSANGKTEHKQPQRKKKHKKSKEAR